MTYVDTRTNVWEALAGRAPGEPTGPTDPGLWGAVVDRLNPARARPVLRAGIEAMQMTAVRGGDYIMLRSPDDGSRPGYLRLTPEEWQLALLMDGSSTVTLLVAEFARIAGRLAPDEVRRVVADLAGHRMLDELPMDAFRPLDEMQHQDPERTARGRRTLVFDADGFATSLYRAGGRFFFGKVAAAVQALLVVAGLGLFALTWIRGGQSLFLSGGSYLLGAVVLILLNVLVVAGHQLSHALAAKHVGRDVPAGGFVLYFGIPSFFLDTADAWMAGRRARMLVSAVGPLSSLMLAGLAQTIGYALPMLGGLAFKLAFLWYLNAFLHLSPLLPLDGHYLLSDWLEIPQLRGRALSWIGGRLRGRPPRWSVLDREGRIIGLYGMLAVLWLAVAAILAVRIWSDRVDGLVTGLWHAGFGGVLLLLLIVVGLFARPIYFLLGRATRAWRGARQRSAENDREGDTPRRLAALLASDLGGLPEPALHGLASRARWVHAPAGRQLVLAGGAQSAVHVVVDGTLHARKPGDPPGTIRHQVGPGGVVGLVNALGGRATQLDWYAAGTTSLSIPAATVATVVGPLPGPPPDDLLEAEALFADTPALAALAVDQRLALIASAHPVDLEAGAPVILPGPTHAVVVESGVIAMADDIELRRGTLIGPVGDGSPGMVAQARTPVRLWVVPDASDLPPLVGATHRPGSSIPVVSVRGALAPSVVSPDSYPPLAVPPGPPPEENDAEVDRRFERRLWWLVAGVLVVALVLAGLSVRSGPAWAEMPSDKGLLTVDSGVMTVVVAGDAVTLAPGDRRYVGDGTQISVPVGARGRLTFPGGAAALFCGGAQAQIGKLDVDGGRSRTVHAVLTLQSGRVLADTAGTSGAYQPLALTVARARNDVSATTAAWFWVEPAADSVSTGKVTIGTTPARATHKTLGCGDGVAVTPPASETPDPALDAPLPSDSASVAPVQSVAPSVTMTLPTPTGEPTTVAPRTTPPVEATQTTKPAVTHTVRPPTRPTTKPTTRPTTAPTTPATTAPTTPPTTAPTTPPSEGE
ncbi:cyclic nucleotide-binding protein [Actinoplanes sp. NPDC051343]|uniref:cyclic nucleotide-binding protein n=1 Tax=Actinoplanes sp. NPDC051343 TaxID=3363906 RepID=UPI0037927FEB